MADLQVVLRALWMNPDLLREDLLMRFALILFASTCLTAAEPAAVSRKAAAFDISAPLSAMEQFIPDKRVTIRPAELSNSHSLPPHRCVRRCYPERGYAPLDT